MSYSIKDVVEILLLINQQSVTMLNDNKLEVICMYCKGLWFINWTKVPGNIITNIYYSLYVCMYVLQQLLYDSNSMYVVFCSLLKVHLQLRGFSVFLDIEKLKAGKFDENLLSSVKLAKNFILVLTPNALDRCMGDDEQNDWVHKVC